MFLTAGAQLLLPSTSNLFQQIYYGFEWRGSYAELSPSFSFQRCSGRRDNISDSSQSTPAPAWFCTLPRSPSLSVWGCVRLTALCCSDRVGACFHLMSQPTEAQVFLIQTPNSPWRRLMSLVICVQTNSNCTQPCQMAHTLSLSLNRCAFGWIIEWLSEGVSEGLHVNMYLCASLCRCQFGAKIRSESESSFQVKRHYQKPQRKKNQVCRHASGSVRLY